MPIRNSVSEHHDIAIQPDTDCDTQPRKLRGLDP
jgi:hypothetical protein